MKSALEHIVPLTQNKSASQRVAERLRELIASGNLAPGEKLPSENELVRALQVSRPVVREALRGLNMMGIVERVARAAAASSPTSSLHGSWNHFPFTCR